MYRWFENRQLNEHKIHVKEFKYRRSSESHPEQNRSFSNDSLGRIHSWKKYIQNCCMKIAEVFLVVGFVFCHHLNKDDTQETTVSRWYDFTEIGLRLVSLLPGGFLSIFIFGSFKWQNSHCKTQTTMSNRLVINGSGGMKKACPLCIIWSVFRILYNILSRSRSWKMRRDSFLLFRIVFFIYCLYFCVVSLHRDDFWRFEI